MKICLKKQLILFFILIFVGSSFASDTQFQWSPIGISDASASVSGNSLSVSFSVVSSGASTSNVVYGVQITDMNSFGQPVVFEKVFDDKLNLQDGLVTTKQVSVTLPDYLSGGYGVILKLSTDKGLELMKGLIGTIDLVKKKEFIEIIPASCYIVVSGENQKYGLSAGVDIGKKESIVANCEFVSHFTSDVSVYPVFETKFRDSFGALLNTTSLTENIINLKSAESSKFSIIIPVQEKPQAYTALLKFKEGNDVVSNEVGFHYVIQGVSATIQKVSLDKNYYRQGDAVKVNVFWSGSADSFSGARGPSVNDDKTLVVSIDSNGTNCIEPINKSLVGEKDLFELSAVSVISCVNPEVTVKIFDSSGNLLDSQIFLVYGNVPASNFDVQLIIYLGIALIICLGAYFILSKKGRKK